MKVEKVLKGIVGIVVLTLILYFIFRLVVFLFPVIILGIVFFFAWKFYISNTGKGRT